MYYTDDPVRDAERYWNDVYSSPYRCVYCGDDVDEEDVHFNLCGEAVCPDCWEAFADDEDEEGEEE